MLRRASKRSRTEGTAAPPAALSGRLAASLARIARELAELANAAPDVPQLAEMLQLSKALLLGQQGAAAGEAAAAAPLDALPLAVLELVLAHCDARSLARMSCASRCFGGGRRRSLVERVAWSPARRATFAPALRPLEVMPVTLQLRRLEAPVTMNVALLRQLAKLYAAAPGRRDERRREAQHCQDMMHGVQQRGFGERYGAFYMQTALRQRLSASFLNAGQ